MQSKIYRVLENDEVVAIFNDKEYADDFIDYQATISPKGFTIEEVSLADWFASTKRVLRVIQINS